MDLDGELVQRLRAPREDVWIAIGLSKPYRVVSIDRTYGEWDTLEEAIAFKALLLAGNPHLQEIA